MKTYDNRKREIQQLFYNNSPTRSNVVALAGPNLDLHIKDIKSILTPKSKAYIYDIDLNVINKFKYLESDNQIKLIHGNVLSGRIERFMDIDLMVTLSTSNRLIKYLFQEQYYKYKNSPFYKTFMFTYCHRKNKFPIERFLKLLFLFQSDDKIDNIYLNTTYSIKNRIKDIYDVSYREGAPMHTIQIIWK